MRYYQEITLLPSQDISLSFLWRKVFNQIHIGLVEMKDEENHSPIGVSFPEYLSPSDAIKYNKKMGIGKKLRVFAEDIALLESMNIQKLLNRFLDYVHITGIRPVPDKVKGYAVYRRVHAIKSVPQKARRFAKRNSVSYEEAEARFQSPGKIVLPFIPMKSVSNSNSFFLFINRDERNQSTNGSFGLYGLSAETTVPEF